MERGLYKNRSILHITTTVSLLLIVISMLTDHIQAAGVDVEPDKAILNEGQKTELLCRHETNEKIDYCRIKIPGESVFSLSPGTDKTKTPGFSYFGSGLENGQCGVTIERVTASQNGKFECGLGIPGGEVQGYIDLVVALRPQQPVIEILTKPNQDGSFTERTKFAALCIVRDGRPAANISWLIDDIPIYNGLSHVVVNESLSDKNVNLSTTSQILERYLTPEDNGKTLICVAHHQTDGEQSQPQMGKLLLNVRYAPIQQPDITVYGLYLEQTAMVTVTIQANPMPNIEWTIGGILIPQGSHNERYTAYEPKEIGKGNYNVTLAIAGLTLEDTTKIYNLKASNAIGIREYVVRISSSSTPPSSGLDIGSIVGIAVAVAILVIIILLIGFARATGRWCFGGKKSRSPTSETSDTESADIKTETKSHAAAKSQRLPSFSSLFMRKNEKSKKDSILASDQPGATNTTTNSTTTDNVEYLGESNRAMTASTGEVGLKAPEDSTITTAPTTTTTTTTAGSENAPKDEKQLVYAELVLKPSDNNQPMPSKSSTEYAEIVYVQKPTSPATATAAEKIDSKGKN